MTGWAARMVTVMRKAMTKKIARGVFLPLFAVGMSMGKADVRPSIQQPQQDKSAVKVYNPFVKFFTE